MPRPSRTMRNARHLRVSQADAERRLWQHLRNGQLALAKFRRQQPLGPYVADFCCFELTLVIELDSGQHAARVEEDARRTAWLARQGFRVVRFWNTNVLTNLAGVLEVIRRELASRPV